MTYVLGWKGKDSVFLIADTAGSSHVAPREVLSSAGESQSEERRDHGYFVEESLFKLVRLPRTVIAGAAGDVHHSSTLLRAFRDRLENGEAPDRAFRRSLNAFGALAPLRSVSVVFGWHDGERPRLFSYGARGGELREHDELVQVGSIEMRGLYPLLSDFLLTGLQAHGIPDSRQLMTVLAVCQRYGLMEPLMEVGVGGAFVGIEVNPDGSRWQPDTMTLVLSEGEGGSPVPAWWMRTAVFNDALLLNSQTQSKKVLMNGVGTEDAKRWQQKWSHRVRELLTQGIPEYVVLLLQQKNACGFAEVRGQAKTDYLEIQETDLGYQFGISAELYQRLQWEVPPPKGEVGIGVHYFPAKKPEPQEPVPLLLEPTTTVRGSGGQFLESQAPFEIDFSSGFGWYAVLRLTERGGDQVVFDVGRKGPDGPRLTVQLVEDEILATALLNSRCSLRSVVDDFADEPGFGKWMFLGVELSVTSDRTRLTIWINTDIRGRGSAEPVELGVFTGTSVLGADLDGSRCAHFEIGQFLVTDRPLTAEERQQLLVYLSSGSSEPPPIQQR